MYVTHNDITNRILYIIYYFIVAT